MIKLIYILLLFNSLCFVLSKDKQNLFGHPIISIKAGYHTRDKSPFPSPYDDSFPGGFSIDGTLEIPTGKGWYIAMNYDMSFASEVVYDSYNNFDVSRSFINYSFTPLFIKYRFFVENFALYGAIGIGGSKMVVEYDRNWGTTSDGMIAFNSRLGVDYALKNQLMFSAEIVYHAMGSFDVGGGGRHNRMFQLKLGAGFLLDLPR